jgi:hypothetical protein
MIYQAKTTSEMEGMVQRSRILEWRNCIFICDSLFFKNKNRN